MQSLGGDYWGLQVSIGERRPERFKANTSKKYACNKGERGKA